MIEQESYPQQLRNFMFTWNNPGRVAFDEMGPTEKAFMHADHHTIDGICKYIGHMEMKLIYEDNQDLIAFITYGVEYGEKGTLHFQGYCELKKRLAFSRVTQLFSGMHIAVRRGTQQQAINYCRKDGDIVTYGEQKVQGNRTDLQHIKRLLDTTSSIKTLLNEGSIDTYQELNVALKLLRYTDRPRDYKPQVLWFYGAPGIGKTRLARQLLPEAYFKTNFSLKWWPNYDGEEDVIIDDLTSLAYPFINMLGLLDRYPYQIEDKGLIREFRGRRIIITSHKSPQDTYHYENNYGEIDQLLRRIDLIEKIQ